MKLRPVTYQWRADEAGNTEFGFIAQEVENVLPELVGKAPDETLKLEDGSERAITDVKSLNYSGVVVPLVKAVQELNSRNENLLRRIEALESRLAELAE